jgi:hypothetical protein
MQLPENKPHLPDGQAVEKVCTTQGKGAPALLLLLLRPLHCPLGQLLQQMGPVGWPPLFPPPML